MPIVNAIFLKITVYFTALSPCFQAVTAGPITESGWDFKLIHHVTVHRRLKKSAYKPQILWKLFYFSYNRCLPVTVFHRSVECHRLVHIRGEIFNSIINKLSAMLHRDVNPSFLMLDEEN